MQTFGKLMYKDKFVDILAPRSQYQGYISTRGRAIQCNSLRDSARSWHAYASPAPLFQKYPLCGHNRRAHSWVRLESHGSNVCTAQNASHGELDTKHRWTTLQPPIRSEHVNSTYGRL